MIEEIQAMLIAGGTSFLALALLGWARSASWK
jgi:hypothetical protein